MTRTPLVTLLVTAIALSFNAEAQETPSTPQITMGNGSNNTIEIEGLSHTSAQAGFSTIRVDGENVSAFRGTTSTLTFPEVTSAQTGWLVLHPVIDGRPDGDMVSGFAYLDKGQNEDVAIRIDHPAKAGDRFLVMLHADVDEDHVFDFVFVEDGINVEDGAVFEGTHMIAQMIAVPE